MLYIWKKYAWVLRRWWKADCVKEVRMRELCARELWGSVVCERVVCERAVRVRRLCVWERELCVWESCECVREICVCVWERVCVCLFVCFFVCLSVCLFVCVRYDCHSALHCTVHWIYCTAKLWFGSSLAQAWLKPGSSGTRNSTDAVRRCTVTDRLAWVKTRSWLILHCLVDLKVNLKLRMVAELPGSYCAWRLRRWKSRTVPHCLRWKSRTVPHCNSQ